MVDKDEILLNSKEVAEILDLSPDTVNELARKSVLPAFKRGRQWRFREARHHLLQAGVLERDGA
jgi:excisionase family DNA binding protein